MIMGAELGLFREAGTPEDIPQGAVAWDLLLSREVQSTLRCRHHHSLVMVTVHARKNCHNIMVRQSFLYQVESTVFLEASSSMGLSTF